MIRTEPTHRYSIVSIALHWLMLLLIVAVYAAMEFREFYPKGSGPREALKMWHFMLGLSVLGLVWLRIAARLLWAKPHSPADEPVWRRMLARAVHLALYLFMIAMPLAGWLILSAEGETVPFFGLELPALVGTDKILAEQTEQLHEFGGTIGYWLIGIHAAASLFHHYILKDHVFARMIPVHS
ncbi:cytochrome b [Sphingosinicella humi]|uniref:Cytochrome B n=1 Tax=Allosphingosinicella humi TaxID=2068657 RepID=A0A2U2J3V4_9SPHN|nr:cytochrome b [Sphingosinicella humi]PWG03007.1 cytochrome B [Sphingosinicella humi]